ncbi:MULTISPECIES: hypothetical protein [unclassified Streptomyces]|uniref:hypothetical protein n=1 Tax=unclassified Streptomyces TaxID=2593676 RepID=UPI002E32C04B|nr:hypothetical protein [Streptomyces sp. NBC_01280]
MNEDKESRAAMLRLPTLALRHHAVIAGAPGEKQIAASVGPDGQVIALWSKPRDLPGLSATTTNAGGATFPEPRATKAVDTHVSIHAPHRTASVELSGLKLAHVTVQPLPGDRVLVVGARARWRPEGADRNAIVYDADGHLVAEATLGDGISHVFATHTGDIWVGYFDEGVYGNLGWGNPGTPAPIGEYGLIRFSSDLETQWRFPSHTSEPWGAISDCYALNIDGDTAWACYYTDFPIVSVRDGVVTSWRNSVAGATALAVKDARVALLGGYGPHHDRLSVGTLDSEDLRVTDEYRIVLPDGRPLPMRTQVIGRGPDLHVLSGDDWYRLGLEDIPHTTA